MVSNRSSMIDSIPGGTASRTNELEEAPHLLAAVLALHDHQGGVLRHRFRHHGRALHVPADHLVRPPLVRHLVGGDVEDVVDRLVVVLVEPGDEAERLRVGDGVGQRLREAPAARELHDAHLAVLVGSELAGQVVERLPHRVDHAVDVVAVRTACAESGRARAGAGRSEKRIDHLVHPRRSLAPDQLAAVNRHDDEDDDEERALQDVDHQMGHRMDRRAEDAVDRERVADHVQHAEGQDDEEPCAPRHAGDLHAGLVHELAEPNTAGAGRGATAGSFGRTDLSVSAASDA